MSDHAPREDRTWLSCLILAVFQFITGVVKSFLRSSAQLSETEYQGIVHQISFVCIVIEQFRLGLNIDVKAMASQWARLLTVTSVLAGPYSFVYWCSCKQRQADILAWSFVSIFNSSLAHATFCRPARCFLAD